MCLIIIRNKFSITETEQEGVNHIPPCIRRIPFQDRPYQKTRCSRRLTAGIRAWLPGRRGSNEPSPEETSTAHEPSMMEPLAAADEPGNRTNINHPLPPYSASNSNGSIVEVPTELL